MQHCNARICAPMTVEKTGAAAHCHMDGGMGAFLHRGCDDELPYT